MKEEHKHKQYDEASKQEVKTAAKEEKKTEEPLAVLEKEIKTLSVELARAKEEALLQKDKALRAMAELNNASKRQMKERGEYIKYAAGELALKIIPVLDDFENATRGEVKADENFLQGVKMIYGNLKETLEKEGLQKQDATGKKFDPNLYEAVATEATGEPEKDGVIAEILRPGYMFKDIVLRPAMVKIYKQTEEENKEKETGEETVPEKIEEKEEDQ